MTIPASELDRKLPSDVGILLLADGKGRLPARIVDIVGQTVHIITPDNEPNNSMDSTEHLI